MNYAYARVSSKDQNLERQLNAFQIAALRLIKFYGIKRAVPILTEQTIKNLSEDCDTMIY